MAEGIVNLVVDKLSDAVVERVLGIHSVGEQVEALSHELNHIQAFLNDADMKQKYWVKEVIKAAYDIEDVLDNAFFLKVSENPSKELRRGWSQIVGAAKTMWSRPKKLLALRNLANEMNQMLARIRDINEIRERYGINSLGEGSRERLRLPIRPPVLPDIDDPGVVGFDLDRDNIVRLLLDTTTKRRAVISIVGPGGLGKTTLARKVYNSNDVKRWFDARIWVAISQEFNLMDILRMIIERVEPLPQSHLEGGEEYLLTKLYKTLNGEEYTIEDYLRLKSHEPISDEKDPQAGKMPRPKRYLLVLDDIWKSDLWTKIGGVLPDAKIGSRVIITTRFQNIADDAKPYKLPYLSEEQSLELLFKTALFTRDLSKGYPDDLYEVGKQFVKKCGGLPLTLVVLGGSLSRRSASYASWSKMLQTMNWGIVERECIDVIASSYNDLPFVLKSCFMYFAVFPEDTEIDAQRLFRLWVAEGFIPAEESRTLEDTAKSFLEDLVQRSMIQVSSRSINGSIKCCQVHDIFRVSAMHEAREKYFCTVFSEDVKQPNYEEIRRASLQSCSLRSMKYVLPNARSLLWFGQDLPNCSNFRRLRVLEFVGITSYTPDLVRGLDELIFLKYLGFRNCEISISPCSFQRKKTLETLDVRGTRAELPDDLWTIRTLRHVLCDSGLIGPTSTAQLRNIQTMQWVSPRETWDHELPVLKNLRKLGVCWVDNWVTMTNLFQTLPSLISLGIKGSLNKTISLPTEIVYPKALPHYANLQSLHLQGKWSPDVTLDASLFPPNLLKLTLVDSQLEQNPIPELGKLPNLKKLCLRYRVTNYSGPIICQEGFPVLHCLEVVGSNIKDLKVAQGVMPKLTYLQLKTPINFKFHLTSELEHVAVKYFGSTFEGRNQICAHFPLASFS